MGYGGNGINFDAINARLLSDYLGTLKQWLPNGKKIGPNWCVGSLAGEEGESLKIHARKGVWSDFATGEKGGDPVSLYAAIHGIGQGEAAKRLGGDTQPQPRAPQRAQEPDPDELVPVLDPPEDMPNPKLPACSARYTYRNAEGNVLGFISRIDTEGGKKLIPRTPWYDEQGQIVWQTKAFACPRPLYGLDQLASLPSAVVVLVEGEKCADAYRALDPATPTVTWPGGSGAVDHVDWSPLDGRRVVLWPDADEPGRKCMAQIAEILTSRGCEVKIANLNAAVAKGWDVADAIAEGWTHDDCLTFLGLAERVGPRELVVARTTTTDAPTTLISLELGGPDSDSDSPPVAKHDKEREDDIILPGGAQSIVASAWKIEKRMAGNYYGRGPELLRVKRVGNGLELEPISEKKLCSEVEHIGAVVRWVNERDEHGKSIHGSFILVPATMNATTAGTLLPAVVEGLPKIRGVVNFPRLRADGTVQAGEFDAESGLLCAKSVKVESLTCDEGVRALTEILRDFNPATQADKSRMMAALLAPALRFGPWANERVPFPLFQVQADDSQTGKGYLVDAIASIYGETAEKVTQGDGRGVGGFEEKVHTALAKGKPLVSFDNLRGTIASTFLESFVTAGGPVALRIVGRTAETDSRAHLLYLTDNGITMTTDLANRLLSISLRKQPPGYQWHKWADGGACSDLQAHIAKRHAYYLGAVYAVVRAWIAKGMLTTNTTHHQRQVVGALNWMIREVFQWPDVMDGHEAVRARQTSPVLAFLLEIAKGAGVGDYSATELLEAANEADVPLPATIAGRKDDNGPKKQLGINLRKIFKDRQKVSLGGGWTVEKLSKPMNYAKGAGEVYVYRLALE
jgi:putative DNA primase/helicase